MSRPIGARVETGGIAGRRQSVMTCRGGFQTRPCGVHDAEKRNAANEEEPEGSVAKGAR